MHRVGGLERHISDPLRSIRTGVAGRVQPIQLALESAPGCAPIPPRHRPRNAGPGTVWCSRGGPAPRLWQIHAHAIDGRGRRRPGTGCRARCICMKAACSLRHMDIDFRRRDIVRKVREHPRWTLPFPARISSSRAALYMPSSKPYQRSLKKMWPLISPASGAADLLHLGFDQRVAGLPHQRPAAVVPRSRRSGGGCI